MTNRRAFLATAPASLLGLPQLANNVFAQEGAGSAEYDKDIASFWANHMAVPPEDLGADVVLMRAGPGSPPATFEREPFLLYYDDTKHELVPATDVKPSLPSGDAMLNLEMARYRLNSDDQSTFSRY